MSATHTVCQAKGARLPKLFKGAGAPPPAGSTQQRLSLLLCTSRAGERARGRVVRAVGKVSLDVAVYTERSVGMHDTGWEPQDRPCPPRYLSTPCHPPRVDVGRTRLAKGWFRPSVSGSSPCACSRSAAPVFCIAAKPWLLLQGAARESVLPDGSTAEPRSPRSRCPMPSSRSPQPLDNAKALPPRPMPRHTRLHRLSDPPPPHPPPPLVQPPPPPSHPPTLICVPCRAMPSLAAPTRPPDRQRARSAQGNCWQRRKRAEWHYCKLGRISGRRRRGSFMLG